MLNKEIIGLRVLTERDSDSRENFPKYTRNYYSYNSYDDFLLNEHVRALHLVCKLTRLSQIPPFLSLTQNLKQFAEVFLYRKMLNWLKFLGIFPRIQSFKWSLPLLNKCFVFWTFRMISCKLSKIARIKIFLKINGLQINIIQILNNRSN